MNLWPPVSQALIKNENDDELMAIILDEDWQDEQDWLTADRKGNLSLRGLSDASPETYLPIKPSVGLGSASHAGVT
jgi:hypothetical protein